MIKIVKILYSDILFDNKAQGTKLSKSCNRRHNLRVSGVVVGDNALFVAMEQCENASFQYHIVPMDSAFDDDIAGDISSRFFAGFALKSGFRLDGKMWAIFEEKIHLDS